MDPASFTHSLIFGAVMSLLMFVLVFGSLAYNAEIWLNDYPPDVKEKYGPPSEKTVRQRRIFSIIFFLALGALLALSVGRLPQVTGRPLNFLDVFINLFTVFMVANLVDLLVFDWLIAVTLKPKFMILPGTEGMAGYRDYGFHFRAFLNGTAGGLVAMALLAGIITLGVAWFS